MDIHIHILVIANLYFPFLGPLKEIANFLLFFVISLSVYTHWASNNGMDKMTPALVFGLLLACRYIVHLQVRARTEKLAKETATKETKKTQ